MNVDPSGKVCIPCLGIIIIAGGAALSGCNLDSEPDPPTPTPIPTAAPSDYRLTNVDWVGQGLVQFGGASWGIGNQEAVELALDVISRVTSKTPNDLASWVAGNPSRSYIAVNSENGTSLGGAYSLQNGSLRLYAANLDREYLSRQGITIIVHELAHGIDLFEGSNGETFTQGGGFEDVGWENVLGSWHYSGNTSFGTGSGPANNYITTPLEDFANSFTSVVFEMNINMGLISTSGNDPSSIIAITGDSNSDGSVGVDEPGPVGNVRRQIIQSLL